MATEGDDDDGPDGRRPHRWRGRRGRAVVLAVIVLVAGVEARSQLLGRAAAADREAAQASRRDGAAADSARTALEADERDRTRDADAITAELARARAELGALGTEIAATTGRQELLTGEIAALRADLEQAGLALLAGTALIDDLRRCLDATHEAVNHAAFGGDARARVLLDTARQSCARAAAAGGAGGPA